MNCAIPKPEVISIPAFGCLWSYIERDAVYRITAGCEATDSNLFPQDDDVAWNTYIQVHASRGCIYVPRVAPSGNVRSFACLYPSLAFYAATVLHHRLGIIQALTFSEFHLGYSIVEDT